MDKQCREKNLLKKLKVECATMRQIYRTLLTKTTLSQTMTERLNRDSNRLNTCVEATNLSKARESLSQGHRRQARLEISRVQSHKYETIDSQVLRGDL